MGETYVCKHNEDKAKLKDLMISRGVILKYRLRNKIQFHSVLKKLRKERKLTQQDVGDILNYGYTAISNYESGRNEPALRDLYVIAKFFGVTVDFLLTGEKRNFKKIQVVKKGMGCNIK